MKLDKSNIRKLFMRILKNHIIVCIQILGHI